MTQPPGTTVSARHDSTEWWGALGLLVVLLVIYLPALGHGFIKDDFAWIASSQVTSVAALFVLFTEAADFYRPVVGLSFAVDWWLFGLSPLAFGLTNLALLLAAAFAVRTLALALGMQRETAMVAAALFCLNYHGINTSLLWISGRTSLLVTLFALLAASAFVGGRRWRAMAWTLVAMLSKEDAVLLPFVLLLWSALDTSLGARPTLGGRLRTAVHQSWPLFVVLTFYLAIRTAAGGMTPMSATSSYQFVLEPASVALNLLAYLDRAGTLSAGVVVLLALAAVAVPRPRADERRWVLLGSLWLVVGLALAVLLPARSSLLSIGPSAGAALAGAALITALWEHGSARARSRIAAAGALIVSLILVPIHWARNDKWVEWAQLSTHVLNEVAPVAGALPPGKVVQIDDERGARMNLDSSFGTLIEPAMLVHTGRSRGIWIEPPPVNWQEAGLVRPHPRDIAARFALRGKKLVRLAVVP